jgi:hypothetical protein
MHPVRTHGGSSVYEPSTVSAIVSYRLECTTWPVECDMERVTSEARTDILLQGRFLVKQGGRVVGYDDHVESIS